LPELAVWCGTSDKDRGVDFHDAEVSVGHARAVSDSEGLAVDGGDWAPGVDDSPALGLFELSEGFGAVGWEAAEGVLEGAACAGVGLICEWRKAWLASARGKASRVRNHFAILTDVAELSSGLVRPFGHGVRVRWHVKDSLERVVADDV
jgi:hypothetical protein